MVVKPSFILTMLLIVLVGVLVSPLVSPVLKLVKLPVSWHCYERRVIEYLGRENLAFLITDKLVTKVIIEVTAGNILLGRKEGYLIAKVKIYHGIAVGEIKVEKGRGKLILRIPEPKAMDVSVDYSAAKFISKRSGLVTLADWIMGKDLKNQLLSRCQSEAMRQLRKNKYLPDRLELIHRLSAYSQIISRYVGCEIEFM